MQAHLPSALLPLPLLLLLPVTVSGCCGLHRSQADDHAAAHPEPAGEDPGGHGRAHHRPHADHPDAPEAGSHEHVQHGDMPHRFDDPERWAKRFESPARDAWQRPDEVVALLVDRPDLVILDIGAATGYFPVRFAPAVPQGRVIGADIEQSMVQYLGDRAQTDGLANVEARLVAPDDAGVASMDPRPDLVFLCNTYHHIADRAAYFGDIADALRDHPGARLAVVDFREESKLGPPREHKVAAEVVIAELAGAGWALAARHETLPEQYVLVFEVAAVE